MSRRAIPVNVSLSVEHTQPATPEKDEDGYYRYWGLDRFENGDIVDTSSWVPHLTISATSEAPYPIQLDSGYFRFNPAILLPDSSYQELAMKPSRDEVWLSPGGTAGISFSPGPVTNAIVKAIQKGTVESFGVETYDGLRVEGPTQALAEAAEYIERFFRDVDIDRVWENLGENLNLR
jgi:hypothetical protein